MLDYKENQKIYSSFIEKNIYTVERKENIGSRKKDYEQCSLRYLWNDEKYRMYIMHFYEYPSPNTDIWLFNNYDKSFGGKILNDNYICPSDFVRSMGMTEDNIKSSLGLIYPESQFEGVLPAVSVLNRENVIPIMKRVLTLIMELHAHNIALNGLNDNQIWCNTKSKKIRIQLLHNTVTVDEKISKVSTNLSETSKTLGENKVYRIPLKSWLSDLDLLSYVHYNDIYSWASILFRYLIGRHPLDGRLCDDLKGDDMKQVIYNQNPVFIFDKNDHSNSIGSFTFERGIVDQWNSLNPGLKELFTKIFTLHKNDQEQDFRCLQGQTWMECLEHLA